MTVLIREFGELALSRLKGDQIGESTKVKKALLQFMRKVRHYQISVITDWQKTEDVESSIRNHADIWILKRITQRLAGNGCLIKSLTVDGILERFIFSKKAFRWANSVCPPIDKLGQKWMYVVHGDDTAKLPSVPEVKHQHKEPWMIFEKITGINFKHQENNEPDELSAIIQIPNKKLVYYLIFEKRNPKSDKPWSWKKIHEFLIQEQEKGTIIWEKPFNTMKLYSLSKWFERKSKIYGTMQ